MKFADIIPSGSLVRHSKYGNGAVEYDKGATALVRFDHGIEEVDKSELSPFSSPLQVLIKPLWDSPIEVITKTQAAAITSVNDAWGVFSRSKIALLPHQLWVCRRVNETWPTRWMVADDVGLGKTIEAGLILWPLLSKGTIRRLLIMCPASLVDQWQYRLREMFDIRMAKYLDGADTDRSDFWNTNQQVVASFHTLREDNRGRHKRLFESDPWDLVIVDEAHHLNSDEKGQTLAYRLLSQLQEKKLAESIVFFTGTPHRGKNFGFLALLKLLRPDLFDPREDLGKQLPNLRQVLIRNNKQSVTDLKGNKLFKQPIVTSETYEYSEQESEFYKMLTEFIITGKMYAGTLGSVNGRAVMLVLISMQKLASSSVAAIRRALKGRLARIVQSQSRLSELTKIKGERQLKLSDYEELESGDEDGLSKLEEEMAILTAEVRLMEDELPRLQELIAASERVTEETKIKKIISVLKTSYADRSVLFFTEYKATQSLLLSKLFQEFGNHCAAFINGDNRAEEVIDSKGSVLSLSEMRDAAAERFNSGEARFLVSTEAGGEGIDLQENCHSLVHVDLPWNPMRLHQRVGRLNRYGQKYQVEVVNLRNPDTVESLIWDKLNEKIENIMQALGSAMDEPEDLLQLVLGMTSPSLFREVFSGAPELPPDSLSKWFDTKTAQFGGQDAIDTVKKIVGNCEHFDFNQISPQLPRIDLPALEPFFEMMLAKNGRRISKDGGGISFKTPEAWLDDPGVRTNYDEMVFDRNVRGNEAAKKVLGVGHKVIDQALRQALDSTASVASITAGKLKAPVLVFKIFDSITGERTSIRNTIVGMALNRKSDGQMLYDWELLLLMNEIEGGKQIRADSSPPIKDISFIEESVMAAKDNIRSQIESLDLPFKRPMIELFSIIWPHSWSK